MNLCEGLCRTQTLDCQRFVMMVCVVSMVGLCVFVSVVGFVGAVNVVEFVDALWYL